MSETPTTTLRSVLGELGAAPVGHEGDGPFRNETYAVGQVLVALHSDYGNWRANLSYDGHGFFPASFWLAVLSGSREMPVPAVTDGDLPRLAVSLRDVIAQAAGLLPAVEAMGEDYRAAMRGGLS